MGHNANSEIRRLVRAGRARLPFPPRSPARVGRLRRGWKQP